MSKEARTIQVPATLDGVTRKKDRSVTFRFTSLFEVTNEDFAVMDTFHQSAGHLLFRENLFTEEEVPTEDVDTDVAKSQSVQIRDALWVLYKAKGKDPANKEAWNTFYRQQNQGYKSRILDEVHRLEEGRQRQ
jgi:hypothetical protein